MPNSSPERMRLSGSSIISVSAIDFAPVEIMMRPRSMKFMPSEATSDDRLP